MFTGCSACVEYIPILCISNLSVLLKELLVRRSQHSVSFRKLTCLCQELTIVKRESAPKEFSKIGMTVKYSSFCQQTQVTRFTFSIFPYSVPTLKIHIWDKQKLSTKDVVWTGCSLCCDWHTHTRNFGPRCSIRWAPNKEIQAQCFHQKSHLLPARIECSEERINTQSVFLGGFESETF